MQAFWAAQQTTDYIQTSANLSRNFHCWAGIGSTGVVSLFAFYVSFKHL